MPIKYYITISVSLAIWLLLLGQHISSGIPSHYILHSEDMPAISNAWGGLLLPLLTWFSCVIHEKYAESPYDKRTVVEFIIAALYGVGISVTFFSGLDHITSILGPLLVVLAAVFRIYQPQFILGFVLAMSYGFGAVLPTGFIAIIASVSFLLHRGLYPLIMRPFQKN